MSGKPGQAQPAIELWLYVRLLAPSTVTIIEPSVMIVSALAPGDMIVKVWNYSAFPLQFTIYRAADNPQQWISHKSTGERRERKLSFASLAVFAVRGLG